MANNRIIVAPDGTAGAILGIYDVFGTNTGSETVTVYDNTIANFQGDFARGGDVIRLTDFAEDFTIRLAGSNAELVSLSDSITVSIPIGIAGVTVQFETAPNVFSDARTLVFNGTDVVLDGQIVTGEASALNPYSPPPAAASSEAESPQFAPLGITVVGDDAPSSTQVEQHFAAIDPPAIDVTAWHSPVTAIAISNIGDYTAYA